MENKQNKAFPKTICKICKKFHQICSRNTKFEYPSTRNEKSHKKRLSNLSYIEKLSTDKNPNQTKTISKRQSSTIQTDNYQAIAIKQVMTNELTTAGQDQTTKSKKENTGAKTEEVSEYKSKETFKKFEEFYREFSKNKQGFQRYILGCYFILDNSPNNLIETTKILKGWVESSNESLLKQSIFLFGYEKNKEYVLGVVFSNLMTKQKAMLTIYKEAFNLAKIDCFRQVTKFEIYFIENYLIFKPIGDQILLDGICIKINNGLDNKKIFLAPNSAKLYDLSKKINFVEGLEELTKKEICSLCFSSQKLKDNYLKIDNLDDFKKFTHHIFCRKKKISNLELFCWVHHLRKYSKQQSYDDLYNTVPFSKTKFIFAIWQKINNAQKISYDEIKSLWNPNTKKTLAI